MTPKRAKNSVILGIYVPAQTKDKDEFWDHLKQLNLVVDVPCYFYLNELANPTEKIGEQALPNSKFQRLNKLLFEIDAESIQVKGKIFKWKKKLHTHLIYERLDRAISRKDWLAMYPNTVAKQVSPALIIAPSLFLLILC